MELATSRLPANPLCFLIHNHNPVLQPPPPPPLVLPGQRSASSTIDMKQIFIDRALLCRVTSAKYLHRCYKRPESQCSASLGDCHLVSVTPSKETDSHISSVLSTLTLKHTHKHTNTQTHTHTLPPCRV